MDVKEETYPKGVQKGLLKAAPELVARKGEGVAAFGLLSERGRWIDLESNACHAALRVYLTERGWETGGSHRIGEIIPKYVVNAVMQTHLTDEQMSPFFEWLFNYSPYESVFKTKSPKTALRDGVYVAYTDVPSNLLAGGLIAGRAVTEYTDIAVTWAGLVKYGVHPSIAFMWAHKLSSNPFCLVDRSSHVAVDGRGMGDCHVLNFLQNVRQDQESYRETGRYSHIHWTWYTPRRISPTVIAKAYGLMQDLARGKPTNNPFDLAGHSKVVEPEVGFEAFSSLLKEGYKAYV